MVKVSDLWPIGAPSSCLLCFSEITPEIFESFPVSWHARMFSMHFVHCLRHDILQDFFEKPWFLLVGNGI